MGTSSSLVRLSLDPNVCGNEDMTSSDTKILPTDDVTAEGRPLQVAMMPGIHRTGSAGRTGAAMWLG